MVKNKTNTIEGKKTLLYYWQEIRKYKLSFFLIVITTPAAMVILNTVVPYFISLAIGSLSVGNIDLFNNQIFWMAIFSLIGVTLNLTAYQIMVIHESKIRLGLAHSVMDNLLQKDQGFFANQRIGALTGKFIDFINSHMSIQDLFIVKITTFTISIGLGLVLIWQKTPVLALIVFGLIAILLLQVKISRTLRDGLRRQRKELVAESNGLAADIITNNITVKTFASENAELAILDDINSRFKKAYVKDLRLQSVDGSGRIFVMQLVQIIAMVIMGGMLANKTIDIGIAIFIIIYLQKLSGQLFELGEILFGYDKIMLQATPMTEILIDPPKVTDKTTDELIVKKGLIEFCDVTYSYCDSKNKLVLNKLNLKIPAGQKIGLVGSSGAGKTTITKLVLRFDDLNSGQIKIDNQDISLVTQSSLRQSISYVPQEPMLFHRSLRENIAYGKPNATEKEIIEVTKLAHSYDFIKDLPAGLDTIVGERGVKLSGGQRQRIAIARAMLKNAPILILDEATSALDSESESMIQKSLKNLMAGRTSIVVAHRLSTISKLDRIIVLDEGKIIEDGTHLELITKNGLYAKLWNHQSGGFIDQIN